MDAKKYCNFLFGGLLGGILEAFGSLLGGSWALLGASWARLGRSCARLGRLWETHGEGK